MFAWRHTYILAEFHLLPCMWNSVGSACVSAARQTDSCMQADVCTPYTHICRGASPPRYAPLCSLQTQQLSLHLPSVSDGELRPPSPAAFLMGLIITYCRNHQWYLLPADAGTWVFYFLLPSYSPALSCAPSIRQVINVGLCKKQQLFHLTHAKILLEIKGLQRRPGVPSL